MKIVKLRLLIAVIAIILLMGLQSNSHALSLRLDDLNDGLPAIELTDGGTGIVNYNSVTSGPIGIFNVVITTAMTYPIIGTQSLPQLDLSSVNVNSTLSGPHTLQIVASANDYNPTISGGWVGYKLDVGGTTTGGELNVAAYLDDSNNLFGMNVLLATLGPFSNGAFADTGWGEAAATSPFSLTLVANITHTSPGSFTSFDAQIVPEPGTLILLGSGLAGLGLFGRRKFKRDKGAKNA